MDLERIKKIVAEYNELDLLVRRFVKEIGEYDLYYTAATNYLESFEIEVDRNLLSFTLDDSYSGCTDYISFDVPLDLLILSGNELKVEILKLKEDRELQKLRKEEQRKERELLERKNRERNQYEKLRKKFENNLER
jgi:hypothetical protein